MSSLICDDIIMLSPKTDGQAIIPISPGITLSGTWAPDGSTNLITVSRTVSSSSDYYRLPVVIPHRTTTSKGVEIISYSISYNVTGGSGSDDGIVFELLKQAMPVDGSAVSAGSVVAGDSENHYDSENNSTVKRLTTGSHTVTVTVPTPAYIADGEQYYLQVHVLDYADADLGFALTGAIVNYNEAPL